MGANKKKVKIILFSKLKLFFVKTNEEKKTNDIVGVRNSAFSRTIFYV